MYSFADQADITARTNAPYDERDRFTVDADFDTHLDDINREITELRHVLLSR